MHNTEENIEAVAKKLLEITLRHGGGVPSEPEISPSTYRGGFQNAVPTNQRPSLTMQPSWGYFVDDAKELIRLIGSDD